MSAAAHFPKFRNLSWWKGLEIRSAVSLSFFFNDGISLCSPPAIILFGCIYKYILDSHLLLYVN